VADVDVGIGCQADGVFVAVVKKMPGIETVVTLKVDPNHCCCQSKTVL